MHLHSNFQTYADIGIQYFIVETLDAAATEMIRLLAEEVMPHVTGRLEADLI